MTPEEKSKKKWISDCANDMEVYGGNLTADEICQVIYMVEHKKKKSKRKK